METDDKVEKVSFRIESNNCLLRTTCALCGCYDRPDVTWCVTDEEGHWICPACAEANDPVLAEVVQTAIEGHFGKLEREAWGEIVRRRFIDGRADGAIFTGWTYAGPSDDRAVRLLLSDGVTRADAGLDSGGARLFPCVQQQNRRQRFGWLSRVPPGTGVARR